MKKPLCIITAAVLLAFTVMEAAAYNITGRVTDSDGEPLVRATVRLLSRRDSSVIKGALTNDNGAFRLPDVAPGRYVLQSSYIGFSPVHKTVTMGKSDLALGAIALADNAITLKSAVVTGVRPAIKVMEDTVEFTADTYKVQPNAVVEDLLKRLPGVEVDSEGKITANGKEVTKILIDGKEFFSDDPKVASKNLPVNMVEKLQVVDRKSDLSRLTGVEDGEEETVINLTVKKGMQNGWFGTAQGGYGTDGRYKASFNINRFSNGNQITLLGGINNVGDLGFTDGGSRFRRFGGSQGISTSRVLGINFNIGNGEKFRFGGNVMYSNTNRRTEKRQDRQYLFSDSTSYLNSESLARDKGHNLRADFRMQWKPDSFNNLEFRPNISLNYNDANSLSTSETRAGDAMRTLVTKSVNRAGSTGRSFEFGGRLIFSHSFRSRPGRSLSLMLNYRTSSVRERSETYSLNRFYLIDDPVDLYDQYADDHTWSNTISSRLTWTEPIGNPAKGHFVEAAYSFSYRWNNADKLTYDHPVSFPDGPDGEPEIGSDLIFNSDLSNRFRNDYMNQELRLGYKHVSKSQNLNVGLSFVPQRSESVNLIDDAKSIPSRSVWNFAPYMRYRVKFSKTRSLNIRYQGRSSQPSMTQLQPVTDMSDPLNIIVGNPDLDPTFTHNINVRFQDFNSQAQRSIMAMVMARVTQNSIISRTSFDKLTGGRTTTYENVNGVWSLNAFNLISLPLRNRTFSFNNHAGIGYSHSVGFNNDLRNNSSNLNLDLSPGIAFRPENLSLELRPTYRLQYVTNSVQTSANRTVHTYGGTFYGQYYTPFGLVLATDLNYRATSGYSQGYDTKQWIWNASISYEFLAGRAATISLQAYDLLRQRSQISRTVTANYIDDTWTNTLSRYFMVTFSYKFNTFGSGKIPEGARRGPGGEGRRGPGGGAPMGPPPGHF